jgi:putative hydrolase of the HAD superfamily
MNTLREEKGKAYKAIIFDVGDTLLEYYPSQVQIYFERLKALKFDIDTTIFDQIAIALEKAAYEQIIKEQNGVPRMCDKDFETMLDKAALSCIIKEQNYSIYLEKLIHIPLQEQKLRLIPGTLETLTALKEKRIRLAIVSNHHVWLPDYLTKIGLAEFFETIIVSDIVGFEKPDIRIMQIALERLSLKASDCLYVGDHPFDVLCSKKAGLDCAWITGSKKNLPDSVPYKEDFRLNKLIDILDLFGIEKK